MLAELFIFAFCTVIYGCFTTAALIGFGKLKRGVTLPPNQSLPYVSIIISARNEEDQIEICLSQLINQSYPVNCFELILIDDASEDRTYEKAKAMLEKSGLNYQLIRQVLHKGKKQNLAEAIRLSKGKIIVTSDADVVSRHRQWLLKLSHCFMLYHPEMLVMPVDFEDSPGILPSFQIVENLALTAITAGYAGLQKPFMCNGANLAFTKTAFESVNGYQSHLHISSGEDVFLMEDIKRIYPGGIHYMIARELIVKTKPQRSIVGFFHQRVRWAYKAKYNSNALNLFSAFIVLITNLLFLALLVAILRKSAIVPFLSIFIGAKFVFDFLLLFLAADFLGRLKYIRWFLPFQCLYWIYALIIGTASVVMKPYWKGKKVN